MISRIGRTVAAPWLALLAAALIGCNNEPAPLTAIPTLTPFPADHYIGLSDTAAPLAELVSAAYETESGRVAPRFVMASDKTLMNDLEQGALEAIIVHHLPDGSQAWFSPIALDGLVIITHSELGVDALSTSQLQQIFGGFVDTWADAGGDETPIRLYSREAGSGAWSILEALVMKNVPLSSLAQIAASDDFMREQVSQNPGAIGYTMLGGTGRYSTVKIDGEEAGPDTVGKQLYALTTPIYFVSQAEPQGELRDFLAWLQSPSGQAILGEKYGQVR